MQSLVKATVISNADKLIGLNQIQLRHGLTFKDVGIYPGYRSKSYAYMKLNMGGLAPPGVPDLKLTGAFYNKMFIRADGEGCYVNSRDKKAPDLEDKYRDIFGLTDDSKAKLIVKLKPEILKRFRESVKL